jgi:hypothetical protein
LSHFFSGARHLSGRRSCSTSRSVVRVFDREGPSSASQKTSWRTCNGKRRAISADVHYLPVSLSCATQRVRAGRLTAPRGVPCPMNEYQTSKALRRRPGDRAANRHRAPSAWGGELRGHPTEADPRHPLRRNPLFEPCRAVGITVAFSERNAATFGASICVVSRGSSQRSFCNDGPDGYTENAEFESDKFAPIACE